MIPRKRKILFFLSLLLQKKKKKFLFFFYLILLLFYYFLPLPFSSVISSPSLNFSSSSFSSIHYPRINKSVSPPFAPLNSRPYPRLLPPSSTSAFPFFEDIAFLGERGKKKSKKEQILSNQENGVHTVPIYGSIRDYAYYFVDIFVGSPEPQRVSVILDTGSSLLAFSCSSCADCGQHIDIPFDITQSQTAEWVSCDGVCTCSEGGVCKYAVGYEEGSSIMGFLFKDVVQVGDEEEEMYFKKEKEKNSYVFYDSNNKKINKSKRNNDGEEVNKEGKVIKNKNINEINENSVEIIHHSRTLSKNDIFTINNYDKVTNFSSFSLPFLNRRLSTPSTEAYMGCHMYETNLFLTQEASGVMGICFRNENEDEPTVIQQLFNNIHVNSKIFSICFSHLGGVMTVGGYMDEKYLSKFRKNEEEKQQNKDDNNEDNQNIAKNSNDNFPFPIVWSDFPHRSYYSIIIKSIRLGNKQIANFTSSRSFFLGAMVDSGTTYTHLASSAWPSFYENLTKFCQEKQNCVGEQINEPFELCWKIKSLKDLNTFPTFIFDIFGGESIQWKPKSYMYQSDEENNVWCMGIKDNEDDATVLGMSFFINKNIIFDLQNQAIGIAEMDCPERERPEIANMFINQQRKQANVNSTKVVNIANSNAINHRSTYISSNNNNRNAKHTISESSGNSTIKTNIHNNEKFYSNESKISANEHKLTDLYNLLKNRKQFYSFYLAIFAVFFTFLIIASLCFGIKLLRNSMQHLKNILKPTKNESDETVHLNL